MCHPAAAAIHLACRNLSCLGKKLEIAEQRLVALCKVGAVCRPIVLLGVDVEVIVAGPRHVAGAVVVPHALEIGAKRYVVVARRRYEHITSVLEEECIESRVVSSLLYKFQASIGGKIGICIITEIDAHAAEKSRVVGNVALLHRLKRSVGSLLHSLCASVAVVFIIKIGANIHNDGECISLCHRELFAGSFHHPTLGNHANHSAEVYTTGTMHREIHLSAKSEAVTFGSHLSLAQQIHTQGGSHCTRLIGCDAHCNHIVGIVGDKFTAIIDISTLESNRNNRIVKIQLAAIIGEASIGISEVNHKVAKRQVGSK